MSEEEYKNRIGKIDAGISTDRLDVDRELCLLLQKLYLKDRYIEGLQQKVEQLEKEVNEYQKELEKADSITQSCIFQGKQESKISFRNCLNRLEQLENIRKEVIEYVLKNKLYRFKYDDEELFEITTDKKAKDDLLNILNKGSE